ncbi:MAG: hypothetical protein RL885_02455 [Planctomycetota bacterium]
MYETDPSIRDAFSKPTLRLVRVLPHAFLLEGEERTELRGRLHHVHRVRKYFEAGALVCDSKDALVARNGTRCQDCPDRPRCQELLRLYLDLGDGLAIIDLNRTSAQNLFEVEDIVKQAKLDLRQLDLQLEIIDHGRWREVRFTFSDPI